MGGRHRAVVRIVSRYPVLALELHPTANTLIDGVNIEPSCGKCHEQALECADFDPVLAIERGPAKLAASHVACHAEALASLAAIPSVPVRTVYLSLVAVAECCRQVVGRTV